MNGSRATLSSQGSSTQTFVRSPSPQGPSGIASLTGRFFGLSLHAFRVVIECAQRLTVSLADIVRPPLTDNIERALDQIRQDIRRGSKRAYREKSHAAIAEAEQRAHRTPPIKPVWTTRTAPWARHWGLTQRRGRRRMRDWT